MPVVSFIGLERDAVPPAFCGAGVLQRDLHTLPHVYAVPVDRPALLVDVARWQDPANAAIERLGRDERTVAALRGLLGGYAAALYGAAMAAVGGCSKALDWCEQWFPYWSLLRARIADGPNRMDMRPIGMVAADHIRSLQADWADAARRTERRVAAERLAAVYPNAEPTDTGEAKIGFDHPDFGRITIYAAAPKFGPIARSEAVRPVQKALRIVLLAHHIAKANGVDRRGSPRIVDDVILDPDIPSEARAFLKAAHVGEQPDIPAICLPHVDAAGRQAYNMADRACRFRD